MYQDMMAFKDLNADWLTKLFCNHSYFCMCILDQMGNKEKVSSNLLKFKDVMNLESLFLDGFDDNMLFIEGLFIFDN